MQSGASKIQFKNLENLFTFEDLEERKFNTTSGGLAYGQIVTLPMALRNISAGKRKIKR